MRLSSVAVASVGFLLAALSTGCSKAAEPASPSDVLSLMSKAGINCATAGATPSTEAGSVGSITTCGAIYVVWLNDRGGDVYEGICNVAKANGGDLTSPAAATVTLVVGKGYFIAPQSEGDWGGLSPQDISKALPGAEVATGADLAKKC